MSEPILSTDYWRNRLIHAQRGHLHHAVFRCSLEQWLAIEKKHRQILAATIDDYDNVLDAGCGWGRLLTLMPATWQGEYVGIDLSPDFIRLAHSLHPEWYFIVGDLQNIQVQEQYDWAVMISIRPMMKRNLGSEVWQRMEAEIRRVSRKRLYLEYDPDDPGSVE